MKFARSLALILAAAALGTGSAFAQLAPHQDRGVDVGQTYQVGEIDHVSLFSGAVSLQIPLSIEYPVGPDLSYQLGLTYSSKLWDGRQWGLGVTPYLPSRTEPSPWFNAGLGWRLSLGELIPPTDLTQQVATPRWIYVAPDGGRHTFYQEFYQGRPDGDANVLYTRDGTYLRLTLKNDGTKTIEVPNGNVHTFDGSNRLVEMSDRFGNWVRLSHAFDEMVVTDNHQRRHEVHYEGGIFAQYLPRRIARVETMAPRDDVGQRRNQWVFDYEEHQTDLGCPRLGGGEPTWLPFLTKLEQIGNPESPGSSVPHVFSMPVDLANEAESAYVIRTNDECTLEGMKTGVLQEITLPTGGSLHYDYGIYNHPHTLEAGGNPGPTGEPPSCLNAASSSLGVTRKEKRRRNGNAFAAWSYNPVLRSNVDCQANINRTTTLENRVIDSNGFRTIHYFSVALDVARRPFYGLPFTPDTSVTNAGIERFLSTEVQHKVNGVYKTLRRTYVAYETDPSVDLENYDINPREHARSTEYLDDNGISPSPFTHQRNDDWDGVGHYRSHVTVSDLPGPDYRSTSRIWNWPQAGAPILDPPADWILNTYGTELVAQAESQFGSTLVSKNAVHHCFDDDGRLVWRRVLADDDSSPGQGPADLLTWYTYGTKGFLIQEELFGGDAAEHPIPKLSVRPGCGSRSTFGTAQFTRRHAYDFGNLSHSYWDLGGGQTLDVARYDLARSGLPTASYDPSGARTALFYDVRGRLTERSPEELARTTFTYDDPNADILVKRVWEGATLTQRTDHYTAFGLLRKVDETFPPSTPGGANEEMVTNELVHDGNDNVIRSYSPYPSAGARGYYVSTSGHDPFRRPTLVQPPDSNGGDKDVRLFHNGVRETRRTAKVRTPAGLQDATWTEIRDYVGNLIEVRDPEGRSTFYTYDVGDRLVRVVQAAAGGAAQVRTFDYDGRGLLLAETLPESDDVVYGKYDALGQPGTRQVGQNRKIAYEYDGAGRLIEVRNAGLLGGGLRVLKSFEYGTANSGADRRKGKLVASERHHYDVLLPNQSGGQDNYTGTIREELQYAGHHGLLSTKRTVWKINGQTATTFAQRYVYDRLGDLLLEAEPCADNQGMLTCTTQDDAVVYQRTLGRLTGISYDGASVLDHVSYHPHGGAREVRHANGVDDLFAADPWGLPRTRSVQTTGSNLDWSSGVYQYDGAGDITAIGNSAFTYTKLGQLAAATIHLSASGTSQPVSQGYDYDDFGNLVEITGTDGRVILVDPATNRIDSDFADYDGAGNLLAWSGTPGVRNHFYGFDTLDTMVTFDAPQNGDGAYFFYNAADERILRYDLGALERDRWTLRGLDREVVWESERDRDTGVTSPPVRYIYRAGTLAASRESGAVRHFHPDHLGSGRLVTGPGGLIAAFHAYWPYGQEATHIAQDDTPIKFTGHERDLNSSVTPFDDVDYMHARYYAPLFGRFFSVDPGSARLSTPRTWNRYQYASGNPIARIDPDGKEDKHHEPYGLIDFFFNTHAAREVAEAGGEPIFMPIIAGLEMGLGKKAMIIGFAAAGAEATALVVDIGFGAVFMIEDVNSGLKESLDERGYGYIQDREGMVHFPMTATVHGAFRDLSRALGGHPSLREQKDFEEQFVPAAGLLEPREGCTYIPCVGALFLEEPDPAPAPDPE